jgi:cell division protein FtsW
MKTAAYTSSQNPPLQRATAKRIQLDPLVMMFSGGLLLIGLIMVGSSSVALSTTEGGMFTFLAKQIGLGLVGIVLAMMLANTPTERLEKVALPLLGVAIFLLIIVLIPGIGAMVNHSRRWLNLFGLRVQPSEAARVMTFIYLCSYLVRREEEVRTTLFGIGKPLLVVFLVAGLLLGEPDLGAGIVIVLTSLFLIGLAGGRAIYLWSMAGVVGSLVGLIVIITPWRMARLMTFIDPFKDSEGTGYQLSQALMAIGRGEWLGTGFGNSIQKLLWLPEANTDFVFSVYAEEMGFFAVAGLIILYLALILRSLAIARNAADAGLKFQSFLAASFGVWLGLQSFINIAVNLGALPTKGLTLPLLSYGGSSLLVTLTWIGILLRVHHETQSSRMVSVRSQTP